MRAILSSMIVAALPLWVLACSDPGGAADATPGADAVADHDAGVADQRPISGDSVKDSGLKADAMACKTHCDCPQGEFCYYGSCELDPDQPVYCCDNKNCPPGERCVDRVENRLRCAPDPTYVCKTACDCGPAHCCVNGQCVKDADDPWLPGGASKNGVHCRQGVDPTYCATRGACYSGVQAYGAYNRGSFFRAYDPKAKKSVTTCSGNRCFGTVCRCKPGQVCVDTSLVAPKPGQSCLLLSGGECVSRAIAEAIYDFAPQQIFPCCDEKGCKKGSACEVGWRSGERFAYRRVLGRCGSCGDGKCDPWEAPKSCPADCRGKCGDGRCDPWESPGRCQADCKGACGDGKCGEWETHASCPADCKQACGDGQCQKGEVCAADCVCADSHFFKKVDRFCGDGLCNVAGGSDEVETCMSCPGDCGRCRWEVERRGDGAPGAFLGVVARSTKDVVAVGQDGLLLHFDGKSWRPRFSATSADLYAIWGNSKVLIAVGEASVVTADHGQGWAIEPTPQAPTLRGVWGRSERDIWAVAHGVALHFDGKAWRAVTLPGKPALNAIWGGGGAIYAVGAAGQICSRLAGAWTCSTHGIKAGPFYLGVCGTAKDDVFAVGRLGAVSHFDGLSWKAITGPPSRPDLNAAICSKTEVIAVGRGRTIAVYDRAKKVWAEVSTGTVATMRGIAHDGRRYIIVGEGAIVTGAGSSWKPSVSRVSEGLWSVWGRSSSEIYAVGRRGTILRFDGQSWRDRSLTLRTNLWGVTGAPGEVVIVGGGGGRPGLVQHLPAKVGEPPPLGGLAKATLNDAFTDGTTLVAVGSGGLVVRYDAVGGWRVSNTGKGWLRGLWGTATNRLIGVGSSGRRLHYDGKTWKEATSAPTTAFLYDVWGSGAGNVFTVGTGGTILHWNGVTWSVSASGTTTTLYGVWVASRQFAVAVGDGPTVVELSGGRWVRSPLDLRALSSRGYTSSPLRAVWGLSSKDIVAVGDGVIIRRKGP